MFIAPFLTDAISSNSSDRDRLPVENIMSSSSLILVTFAGAVPFPSVISFISPSPGFPPVPVVNSSPKDLLPIGEIPIVKQIFTSMLLVCPPPYVSKVAALPETKLSPMIPN